MNAAPAYDHGPEVAPPSMPEVADNSAVGVLQQQPQYGYQQYGDQQYVDPRTGTPMTKDPNSSMGGSPHPVYSPVGPSMHAGQYPASPYTDAAEPATGEEKSGGAAAGSFCGCTILVFVLSLIIALLSAAVIGLAAGTGVEAHKATNANNQLALMSASLSSAIAAATTSPAAAPSASPTGFDSIDSNCSTDPITVSGTTYQAFPLFGSNTFTIECNKDTPNEPIMSIFATNLDECIDACAAYNKYIPGNFNMSTSTNATCQAVSFIPSWTLKANATTGGAPGNCYLKPGPQNTTSLRTPNIGTEVHAGVLTGH